MVKKIFFLTLFSIGILSLMAFISNDKSETKDVNLINELLEKMHFVQGREFIINSVEYNTITEMDTALLFWNVPYRNTVASFYISATEVTNIEWWDFYVSMKNQLGEEKAKELYYPDTSSWIREFAYSYNYPMTRNYFWNRDYDDYPVVGVSWIQAQAYCNWRTQALSNAAGGKQGLKNVTFRLPTESEWELATYDLPNYYNKPAKDRKISERQLYPWRGSDLKKDGEYLANFGPITDINGVNLKGFHSDGALYSSEVGRYPSNYWGLYDMAGNVAEWVQDTPLLYDANKTEWATDTDGGAKLHQQGKVYSGSDIDSFIEYAEACRKIEKDSYNVDELLKKIFHDKKLLSIGDKRVVKGGAWSDGPAYLQIGSREAFDKEKQSSRIGFRYAVSYDEKYEKYFPKKHWKPKGR